MNALGPSTHLIGKMLGRYKYLYLGAVTTHFEKITHFEKNFQSALNLGPAQRTLKIFFSKCVKFGTSLTHFEKFQIALKCSMLTHFEKKCEQNKMS